ncbi:MAG TPA: hypothetical protein VHK90_11120 [Thermoanaerobaculia bacterium]|nr:hypothetical protein [Thermoanaerobaculia bacterium]
MRTMTIVVLSLAAALGAPGADAQSKKHVLSNGTVVEFGPLTITGSTVEANVTYDATRGVYRYAYTIHAPATNKAPIESVHIDVSGRLPRPQRDPSLQENITRLRDLQPSTTIPVGITVPDAGMWRGGVSRTGNVFLTAKGGVMAVMPGTSASGFVIESKLPPNVRNVVLHPSTAPWVQIWETLADDGTEFEDPPDAREFQVTTTTIGPSDPDESAYFNGGGQSPANVNPFLRYLAPADSRTKLAAGTTFFDVVVNFGTTTKPETFTATLNGVDVRAQFSPAPGATNVVRIPLQPGSNKLQLSISGVTSSGRTATDTDTLTFLVQ